LDDSQNPPNLVLIDLKMPGTNESKTAGLIRVHIPEIGVKVLALINFHD
jgi:DNA-binding NarL/FixJ family response regulator